MNKHMQELIEATEYLIQDKPGTAQFEKWWDTRVLAVRAAIKRAKKNDKPEIVRKMDEIVEIMSNAYLWKSTGRFRDMTFEEGMDAMFTWLTNPDVESPIPPFEEK